MFLFPLQFKCVHIPSARKLRWKKWLSPTKSDYSTYSSWFQNPEALCTGISIRYRHHNRTYPEAWHVKNYSSITILLKSPRPIIPLNTQHILLTPWAFSWNWKSQGKTRCQPRAPIVRPNVTRYLHWSRANHTVLMISASCLLQAKKTLAKSTIHQG